MPGQANLNAFLHQPSPAMQQKAALQAQQHQQQILLGNQKAVLQRNQQQHQQQQQAAQHQQQQVLANQNAVLARNANALKQQQLNQAAQRQQQNAGLRQQGLDLRREQETRLQTGQNVRMIDRATQPLKDRFAGLNEWASHIPTPGGIGVLLFLIFLLLWAVVPVNGKHTRAELLWLTLIGRTKMAPGPDGGGSFDAAIKETGSGGIGSGGNGHSMSATTDLLSQLGVIDFGGGWN